MIKLCCFFFWFCFVFPPNIYTVGIRHNLKSTHKSMFLISNKTGACPWKNDAKVIYGYMKWIKQILTNKAMKTLTRISRTRLSVHLYYTTAFDKLMKTNFAINTKSRSVMTHSEVELTL